MLTLILAGSYAHRPLFNAADENNVIEIKNPGISQVVYHDVTENGTFLFLKFKARKGDSIYISLGIPVLKRFTKYRPLMFLGGPGFPVLNVTGKAAGSFLPQDHIDEIPFPVQTGLLFPSGAVTEPRFFHEHFTKTESWILLEKTITLPATGIYYLGGISLDHRIKLPRFWLSIGTREVFGLGDIFVFGEWTRRIRKFHETE